MMADRREEVIRDDKHPGLKRPGWSEGWQLDEPDELVP